ncbi:hypothetical protein BB560_006299 [Smittium megazygosporum]|uniref:Uncharacterized protein n=1 Tax=Smittium megazygosporum TaxID=133381 RepID=A0A2T9YAL6_9FUNG|nr:hypothetical protein BB560_006299 [Smittium megazygosporum]
MEDKEHLKAGRPAANIVGGVRRPLPTKADLAAVSSMLEKEKVETVMAAEDHDTQNFEDQERVRTSNDNVRAPGYFNPKTNNILDSLLV